MATIDLGKIKLLWRCTYNNGTAYAVDDVVEYTDTAITSTYICTAASTGNAPSSGGTAHGSWAYMAKGAAGTPTTTRGDIIYRGASADARLAKGTTGHYLRQGTNDPYWDSVAADFVKLASGTISGSPGSVSLDNHFDNTTYRVYKLFLSDIVCSGNNKMYLRLIGTDGNTDSSSNYVWQSAHPHNLTSINSHGATNTFFSLVGTNPTDTSFTFQTEITFYDPSASHQTNVAWFSTFYGDGQMNQHIGGGYYANNDGHRGTVILPDTGTISSGYYQLYGQKH